MIFFRRKREESRRTVAIFSAASFLHDVGAEMVFSVWPLFVTHVLGASASALGLIDGLGDAVVSFSQAGAGIISDKTRKRKVFVWMGYFFGCLSRIGYAIAPTWQWAVPSRIIDRGGKIRSAPRDAILSDISNRGNRATHFGVLRSLDNLGAVVGVLAAIALVERIGYRYMFLLASLPSFLAALLIITRIREPAQRIGIRPTFRWKGLSKNLWLFIVLSAFCDLGAFSYSFLILSSHEAGVSEGSVPFFYLLYMIVAALWSLPSGELADRIGRRPVLMISYAFWIITAILFILYRSPLPLALAFICYGIYRGGIDTVQKAFTAELAPKEHITSVLGGFQLILGVTSFFASMIAGVLWDRVGVTAPFLFSIVMTGIASVLLTFVSEGKRTLVPHAVAVPGGESRGE
ncbi:MFS transporter [Candidatus Peribacteria bacterium]|nr:MFS transporter [Candidatus Peribacteria bacterium]